MPQRSTLPLLTLAALLAAAPAGAQTILNFQHGGRATAEAGAFVARATDPAALTYNPAAVTRLGGLQLTAGLDFSNATDEYESDTGGRHRASHTIQFPPAIYLSWRPEGHGRFAYGLGVDTPAWYRLQWSSAQFPGRFLTRVAEARFFEVHPVAAYEIDDHWSVGGGLRYVFGTLEDGFNVQDTLADGLFYEVETLAKADVDALSFDLGVQYEATVWGFGAVYRHGADFSGSGDFRVSVRDITVPSRRDEVLALFPYQRSDQSFALPREIRLGAWVAPYPELRVELDAALTAWSSLDDTGLVVRSSSVAPVTVPRPRRWDDTVSLRLGVEGDLTDQWTLAGGIAWEPSPVPDRTLEPGFPRGDDTVYAVGGSYNLPQISFDLGYSRHQFSSRTATGQEVFFPDARGRYTAHEQVWSASARWRF
jgi:long-chain fatty acid transport protein